MTEFTLVVIFTAIALIASLVLAAVVYALKRKLEEEAAKNYERYTQLEKRVSNNQAALGQLGRGFNDLTEEQKELESRQNTNSQNLAAWREEHSTEIQRITLSTLDSFDSARTSIVAITESVEQIKRDLYGTTEPRIDGVVTEQTVIKPQRKTKRQPKD